MPMILAITKKFPHLRNSIKTYLTHEITHSTNKTRPQHIGMLAIIKSDQKENQSILNADCNRD